MKKFRLPVPCETSFFLSAAERRLSGWEYFFLMFFFFGPLPRPLSPRLLGSAGRRWPEPGGDRAWALNSSPGGGQVGKGLVCKGDTLAADLAPTPSEALGWECIYTLNNTLITSVSQLLAFEHRYNRILQAT